MTVEHAFNLAMADLRNQGFSFRGKDIAAIAAFEVFSSQASSKQFDPRFKVDGPKYAKVVILRAYMVAAQGGAECRSTPCAK